MDHGELKNVKKTQGHRGTAVLNSTNGVIQTMKKQNPDFMFLQEIDTHSTRSHYVNQVKWLKIIFKIMIILLPITFIPPS